MTATVTLVVNGASIKAEAGVTVASVLHRQQAALRLSPRLNLPRGLYCGMGVCFECAVTIDGATQRACVTQVRNGMVVEVVS